MLFLMAENTKSVTTFLFLVLLPFCRRG